MDNYNCFFTKTAEKDLNKLDQKLGLKILEKIKLLSSKPKPANSKKLKNTANHHNKNHHICKWIIVIIIHKLKSFVRN